MLIVCCNFRVISILENVFGWGKFNIQPFYLFYTKKLSMYMKKKYYLWRYGKAGRKDSFALIWLMSMSLHGDSEPLRQRVRFLVGSHVTLLFTLSYIDAKNCYARLCVFINAKPEECFHVRSYIIKASDQAPLSHFTMILSDQVFNRFCCPCKVQNIVLSNFILFLDLLSRGR